MILHEGCQDLQDLFKLYALNFFDCVVLSTLQGLSGQATCVPDSG